MAQESVRLASRHFPTQLPQLHQQCQRASLQRRQQQHQATATAAGAASAAAAAAPGTPGMQQHLLREHPQQQKQQSSQGGAQQQKQQQQAQELRNTGRNFLDGSHRQLLRDLFGLPQPAARPGGERHRRPWAVTVRAPELASHRRRYSAPHPARARCRQPQEAAAPLAPKRYAQETMAVSWRKREEKACPVLEHMPQQSPVQCQANPFSA